MSNDGRIPDLHQFADNRAKTATEHELAVLEASIKDILHEVSESIVMYVEAEDNDDAISQTRARVEKAAENLQETLKFVGLIVAKSELVAALEIVKCSMQSRSINPKNVGNLMGLCWSAWQKVNGFS